MSKLQLPDVTLFAADSLDAQGMIKVLEHCKSKIDFGAVVFLTHIPCDYPHKVKIPPLNSLIAYSIFMLTKAYQYIDTTHFLTVQRDGWVLNPQSWDDSWLQNDYTAPLYQQYPKVGSGGFSLRSKRMMEEIAKTEMPDWDWTDKQAHEIQQGVGMYEDGVCSLKNRNGKYKIATLEQGANFAQGGCRDPKYYREYSFGFHRTHQSINFQTGHIDSSDPNRDITQSYAKDIEAL
jgi:hypothetical protein